MVQLEFDYNQKGQKGMPKRIELGWIVRNGVDPKLEWLVEGDGPIGWQGRMDQ